MTRSTADATLIVVSQIPLTVTIITLNEEANISRCIGSVTFAREVIVVDSFSKDRTVEVAQSLGAQVYSEKWRGYGPQKAFATEKASHDWILNIDADEVISPELAKEIQERFSELEEKKVYKIPRRSFYLGRWINHGGWYPDYQKRLFNRKFSNWDSSTIHEQVMGPEEGKLQNPIHHYVFKSISHQVVTNDKYSGLLSERLHQNGKRFSVVKLIIKPFSKFIETYFWKRGFLDGLPGFIISVSAAYSVFLKWAKLWEKEKQL